MGDFLFTIFYGGALVLMGFYTNWILRRNLRQHVEVESKEEEVI